MSRQSSCRLTNAGLFCRKRLTILGFCARTSETLLRIRTSVTAARILILPPGSFPHCHSSQSSSNRSSVYIHPNYPESCLNCHVKDGIIAYLTCQWQDVHVTMLLLLHEYSVVCFAPQPRFSSHKPLFRDQGL